MPDWVGDPFTQVQLEAEELGLEIDEEREFSDDVDQGRVISTTPPAEAEVHEGQVVTVVVSRGAEEVEVPRLVGQTRDEARDLLTEVGLRLGRVTQEASSEPAGTVLRSNPAEGVSVERGTQVDIVLSSGPTPSPSPSPTPEPTPSPTPEPTPSPSPTPSPTPAA
jgi:serine/threonine-protein kinase